MHVRSKVVAKRSASEFFTMRGCSSSGLPLAVGARAVPKQGGGTWKTKKRAVTKGGGSKDVCTRLFTYVIQHSEELMRIITFLGSKRRGFNYSECCCTSAKEEIVCEPDASSACTGQSLIQNRLNKNSNQANPFLPSHIYIYVFCQSHCYSWTSMEDRREWRNGPRCFTRMLLVRLACRFLVDTGWRGMEDEEERHGLPVAKGSARTTGAGGGWRLPCRRVKQTKSKGSLCYSSVSSKAEEGENGSDHPTHSGLLFLCTVAVFHRCGTQQTLCSLQPDR